MFLFESLTLVQVVAWLVVVALLVGLNELSRRGPWAGLFFFVAVPLVLTVFVWPQTAGPDSSTGTWFHWVKVYSALAGALGFMAIRYIPRLAKNRWALTFPAAILAFNILEAIIRDFQVGGMGADGIVDGVYMQSGPWNYMNGVAGIIVLLTISGWMGIYVSQDRTRDMVWPDMTWPYLATYTLWNFAYVYNCVSDHSYYAGAGLLVAPLIAALFIRKGAWLQHRAHTLVFWMMWTMAVPAFVGDSQFAVESSHSAAALFAVSAIALAANLVFAVVQVMKIVKGHKNPFKVELNDETADYDRIVSSVPRAAEEEEPVREIEKGEATVSA